MNQYHVIQTKIDLNWGIIFFKPTPTLRALVKLV